MHDAAMAVVVVDRVVHGRAIVPEGERACFPAELDSSRRVLFPDLFAGKESPYASSKEHPSITTIPIKSQS